MASETNPGSEEAVAAGHKGECIMSAPEKIKLKPCPFCGGKASTEVQINSFDGYRSVHCYECGSEGECKPTKGEAIAAWNSRTDTIPSRAQVAREFYQTAFNRFHHIQSENANFEEALVEVLKELESAEGVKKLPTLADMVGCVNVPDGVEYVREGRDAETV